MMKTVIRFRNDMIMVFDEAGEQIPEYQGYYEDVKQVILKDAPADAVFTHGWTLDGKERRVCREEW